MTSSRVREGNLLKLKLEEDEEYLRRGKLSLRSETII